MIKTYEELLKLDAERTQGQWVYFERPDRYSLMGNVEHGVESFDSDAPNAIRVCDDAEFYPTPVSDYDSKFIAAAPEMMARLKRYREALEVAHAHCTDFAIMDSDAISKCIDVIEEALKDD